MTILAAVGGGERDTDVVRTGRELATAFDEQLVVVHVMDEDEFRSRRDENPDYYQDDGAAEAEAFARERAEAALGVDDVRTMTGIETDGTVGDPASMLEEKAQEHDGRFLVIGGRKQTPVGKVIFGSVTQSVLLNSTVPVVTITDNE